MANDLIVFNKFRYPKVMKSMSGKDSKIDIIISNSEKDYRKRIIDDITSIGDPLTTNYSNNAIIYREHKQGMNLAIDLLVKGNTSKSKRKESVPISFRETKDIFSIFQMIMDSKNVFLS